MITYLRQNLAQCVLSKYKRFPLKKKSNEGNDKTIAPVRFEFLQIHLIIADFFFECNKIFIIKKTRMTGTNRKQG